MVDHLEPVAFARPPRLRRTRRRKPRLTVWVPANRLGRCQRELQRRALCLRGLTCGRADHHCRGRSDIRMDGSDIKTCRLGDGQPQLLCGCDPTGRRSARRI